MTFKQQLAKVKHLIARNGGFKTTLVDQYKDQDNTIYLWSICFDVGAAFNFQGYFNMINSKRKPSFEMFIGQLMNEALNHYAASRSFPTWFADKVEAGQRPHILISYALWTQMDAQLELINCLLRLVSIDWTDLLAGYQAEQRRLEEEACQSGT